MLRILAFLAVVLAAGFGFAWLADRPGEVTIAWLGQEVQTSFLVFLVAAVLAIAAILVVLWLIFGVFRAPGRIGDFFSNRRRERGYRSLTAGILAAGAGDAAAARRFVVKSERDIDRKKEPLLRFLDAQTAMIEGDHARARRLFEEMEKDPDTRLLALRGLYLEAERVNDPIAARHYAERAVRVSPNVPWAGGAVLELKAAEGDFDTALDILKAQRNAKLVEPEEARRMRAVLLTGKAQALVESDPAGAKSAAREAQKLAPDLVPAALALARAMIQLGDTRGASRALEKAWGESAHPEIAELYVHVRPGTSAAERLQRAKKLQSLRPSEAEGDIAVAFAALDAGDLKLARSSAEAAARKEPREAAFLLLADIEDAETGDARRIRSHMADALKAPKDPVWMSDGEAAAEWRAVSPTTGRLDSFEWKTPMERPLSPRIVAIAANEPVKEEPAAVNGSATTTEGERSPMVIEHKPQEDEDTQPGRDSASTPTDHEARKEARFAN
ncbi:heme biosynthesis protein HemY [Aureimonas mangrovi]|uniref:heme biosynthesis protein HemY n=1 Tax=Aureimonas mangrovi TaxID=2758041 RepID=UPI00163DC57F|nr:heme biosynthesis HemY N-terminal domain-containing protein [Aureimonas mangrovi]